MKTSQETDHLHLPNYPPMDETGTVDLSQIDVNLSLTPAERIRRFADFLDLCEVFRAGMKRHEQISKSDSPAA
jgi:hypothetical protein